jgi:hypothetical protein
MSQRTDIYKAAFNVLQAWSGLTPLEGLIEDLPNMKIYLAGGVLRNIILGKSYKYKDFDFFVDVAHIDLAVTHLKLYGSIERSPFESPRWYPNGAANVYCDLIAIERFYNGLWRCEDIVDALNQFDFTANAVALNLRSGEFYDPVNGLRDIHRRVLRAVRFDYPDEPFMPGQRLTRLQVLWLRFVHYTAEYNLSIEPVTLRWLQEHEHYADGADEFSQIFFPLQPRALEMLKDIGR